MFLTSSFLISSISCGLVSSIFVASLGALHYNMSDVLLSFHFQLFQLLCFLQLLLLVYILLLRLATVPSALTPFLLPGQGLSDLLQCFSLHDFLYHLPKQVSSPPSSVPGLRSPCAGSWCLLQCHPTVCSSDDWLGLCTPCFLLVCKSTKTSYSKSHWYRVLEMQPGPASCSHRHW